MASLIVIAKQIHANMVLRHAAATMKANNVTVVINRFFLVVIKNSYIVEGKHCIISHFYKLSKNFIA